MDHSPQHGPRDPQAHERIEPGFHAFVCDGCDSFGAVRAVAPEGVVLYVENAGEFLVPFDAVEAVHAQKVIFDCAALDDDVRAAIGHAHAAEVPGL